jgi:hypothetical protein
MYAWRCGDLIGLGFAGTYSSVTCYYDPQTHALVGARVATDYQAYCDGTSFSLPAGRQPSSSCEAVIGERHCP